MGILPFGFAIFASLGIIWFVIAILICVWVYNDAKSRGENPVLWLIIVLITGIIGLIIWLIVRPEKKSERGFKEFREKIKYCPNCGNEILKEDKYCTACGEKLGKKG